MAACRRSQASLTEMSIVVMGVGVWTVSQFPLTGSSACMRSTPNDLESGLCVAPCQVAPRSVVSRAHHMLEDEDLC